MTSKHTNGNLTSPEYPAREKVPVYTWGAFAIDALGFFYLVFAALLTFMFYAGI